ncbi:GNAT family N-acetyltransferase [Streptomyces sp. SID13031]|uniref:GNAT family N-acetyltransferase n=1 Tax=Streptomyces sp. SID13031 TaxID=2706046 RepID=UPI0013C577C3|nr:GNAT family N-acetyltransferase [Streptomyces sp. SID13031]NEA35632.1 GNAT family N-acetyltransferase [Streptomyces sp. SID13031]
MGTFPEWVEARPIEKTDASEWAALLNDVQVADQNGENYEAEDLVEELSDPKVNAERDTVGLWIDGVMVAYGVVYWRKNLVDVDRLNTDSAVRATWRRRGLGRALLTWMISRAHELHEEHHPDVADAELNVNAISTNLGAAALFTGLGFEECRYSFTLQRLFDTPIPAVGLPDGLRLVSFEPAYDEALRLTHNEVFLDHWGSTPKDEETWKVWFTGSRAFRAGLAFLVLDGEQIVAYAIGYEYEADTAVTGIREVYVGQVGTVRSHRGRGLAAVALSALMTQAAETGFKRASLGVDTQNPTGALSLYERLGFQQHTKWTTYRLPLT